MKKFLAILFALWVLLSCAGCQNKPQVPKDLQIDSVVLLYENAQDPASNKRAVITQREIIAELLSMHQDLRTVKTNQPPAEEGVWIIFRKDETHILEWWIGTTGKDWNDASFLTYSTALTADYQLIKNSRDYTRILEILEEFQDA